MKDPITKEFFQKYLDLTNQVRKCEESIIDRVDYIVSKIVSLYYAKLDTWYFPEAEEGEVGSFEKACVDGESIAVVMIEKINNSYFCNAFRGQFLWMDEDGREWALSDNFPKSWLFKDFEDDLAKGKI